jgi:hypothetical protein
MQMADSSTLSPVLRNIVLASMRPPSALPAPAPAPQGVEGVFPHPDWQEYAGYSFMRFYELPNTAVNTSGFEVSIAHFFKDWIAAEGELDGGVGSQTGTTAKSLFAGAGLRLRRSAPRGLEVWVHGLAGGAHYLPRTTFGSPAAFGYEGGGGVDLNAHHERFAYRVEIDLVGTAFFSTYQVSPKISTGIVYKF